MVTREAGTGPLPAGVVGQVEGIALVYDVIDTFGTTFARGCLDRTVRERVAAGKVRLFLDHGDMPAMGMYDTDKHVGVVRSVRDTELEDGTRGAIFRADLFDTDAGRAAHEYLRAIAATGSETGVSIGMMDVPKTTRATLDGRACDRISELALREISITAVSSVPGTRVTAVRADLPGPGEVPPDSDAASGAPDSTDSDDDPAHSRPDATEAPGVTAVPITERLAWCRAAFARLYD
jgi:HK97 family phage prohead protease